MQITSKDALTKKRQEKIREKIKREKRVRTKKRDEEQGIQQKTRFKDRVIHNVFKKMVRERKGKKQKISKDQNVIKYSQRGKEMDNDHI